MHAYKQKNRMFSIYKNKRDKSEVKATGIVEEDEYEGYQSIEKKYPLLINKNLISIDNDFLGLTSFQQRHQQSLSSYLLPKDSTTLHNMFFKDEVRAVTMYLPIIVAKTPNVCCSSYGYMSNANTMRQNKLGRLLLKGSQFSLGWKPMVNSP